jgi:hypothetical protein
LLHLLNLLVDTRQLLAMSLQPLYGDHAVEVANDLLLSAVPTG